MKAVRGRSHLAAAVFLILAAAPCVPAQVSSVRGAVTDPSGALVAGAELAFTNTGSGTVARARTNESGSYQIPGLAPGSYAVRVERAGFKSLVNAAHLSVGSTETLNFQFAEIGEVRESVEVSDTAGVNTADAAFGNAFQRFEIRAFPLEARNPLVLLSQQPGVVDTRTDDPQVPDTRTGAVNGTRGNQSNITLDGIDVNDQQDGTAFRSVVPVLTDSLQEFRVITAGITAEYGRSSGAQVLLVTRSGTRDYHGALYENHRNSITTANTFFNNATVDPFTGRTLERPKLIRNIFGGSLGGPLPRVPGFFFVNVENAVTRAEQPQQRVVPSETLRQGFLAYRDDSGGRHLVAPSELRANDPAGLGPSPAVLALLNRYPAGNDPLLGDEDLNFTGFRFNARRSEDKPSIVARVDYDLSPGVRLFARGSLARWNEDETPQQFPGQPAARTLRTHSGSLALGSTWNPSENVRSEFRAGLTRPSLKFTGAQTDPSLGFAGLSTLHDYSRRNAGTAAPTYNLTGDTTWLLGRHSVQFGANFRDIHNRRTSEAGSYGRFAGNRLTLAGAEEGVPAAVSAASLPGYVDAQVALLGVLNDVGATSYYDRAGRLLASPYIPSREFINNEIEWYVQDRWSIGRSWTLTAGLRYSYFSPPREAGGFLLRPDLDVGRWFAQRRDNAASGIPSSANPLLSFTAGGSAKALSLFDPDRNNFAPRLAAAWSPAFEGGPLRFLFGRQGDFAVRTGFAMLFDRTAGALPVISDLQGAVGLAAARSFPSGTFDYTTAPRYLSADSLRSIALPPADPLTFPVTPQSPGNFGLMVDPRIRTPYTSRFNLTISRKVKSATVEASYVGASGRKLLVQSDYAAPLVNFKDPVSGQTVVDAIGVVDRALALGEDPADVPAIPFVENVFPLLAGSGLSASQAFGALLGEFPGDWMSTLYFLDTGPDPASPYGSYLFFQPQFDWLPTWTNLGESSYHSLQLSLRRPVTDSMLLDLNYTLAKSLDNGSSLESEGRGAGQILNALSPRQSRGPSDFDVRHQVNAGFVADLPVGGGRAIGSGMSSAMNAILGGWRLSGLARYRTGLPFYPLNPAFSTSFALYGPAAVKFGRTAPKTRVAKSAAGGPNIFADPQSAYDAFESAAPGTSGNRNVLYGPHFFQFDASFQKMFRIGGSHSLTLSWETFNVTNSTNFDGRANTGNNAGIDASLASPATFGSLRSLAGSPRSMQFGLRYEF